MVFQYLEKRDIETFKLVPELDRWLVYRYLTEKTKESAELVPDIHRKFIFYNVSSEEAVKIFIEEGIKHENYHNIFLNLPKKTFEAYEILPEKDKSWAFKYLDERSVKAFKLIPEDGRIWQFRYLDDKNFETISLVERAYYETAAKILIDELKIQKMNLETFKTIPYDFRHYFFQFLEKKIWKLLNCARKAQILNI